MTSAPSAKILKEIYNKLFSAFGPQHWWPGDTPFEVMVGAILTQNTNWANVEKAIFNLKQKNLLSPRALRDVSSEILAGCIRPAGYFNIKTQRLKNFIQFLFSQYHGDLQKMRREPLEKLRFELLEVKGIGPETADSILLYALGKAVFVVDAYTKRVLYRHAFIEKEASYEEIQNFFTRALEHDAKTFNEYHALFVRLGKDFCRLSPRCEKCPLNNCRYSLTHRCPLCYRVLLKRKDTPLCGCRG